MRMFHYKTDSYDVEATVLAVSEDDADSILKRERTRLRRRANRLTDGRDHLGEYGGLAVKIDDLSRMLDRIGYTVKVYEIGQILWTEVS